jgi:hypothetical protein
VEALDDDAALDDDRCVVVTPAGKGHETMSIDAGEATTDSPSRLSC